MLFLLLTGLLALLGQVVLLRELNVAFFGVELIYILAIGVWMLGTALGAVVRPRVARQHDGALRALTLIAGVALPLDVAFIRASRTLGGGVPGAYLSFPVQLVALAVAVLPVSALLGLLFQRAARAHVDAGRTLAEAYGIESLGGVAGGVAATLLPRWGVQNFALAAGCAVVAALGALWSVWGAKRPLRIRMVLGMAGVAVLTSAAAVLWWSETIDDAMTRWNHPSLVLARDTPYGRTSVTRADSQLAVFENDVLSFETQGTTADEFAHLVALQHPGPRRVLLLGGGLEGITREILKHRPARVDEVELDRAMFEAVIPLLPANLGASLRSPNVHVTFADPRRFLQTSSRYDLILVAIGEPASGQTNRFYTREFFGECASRLTATGVLGFRLQSAENVWTPLLSGRMLSLLAATAAVFRDVVVLPGATNTVLASRSALPRDPAVLADRFAARGIDARLVSAPFIRYLYTNDRRTEIERTLARGRALVNSDSRPVCYQYAAMLWLSKFFPRLSAVDPPAVISEMTTPAQGLVWSLLLAALLAAFVGIRRRAAWRLTTMVAVAGFGGMVLETVLLLHYQARSGVLYQDLGLLLTSFMAGLAAGALLMAWLPRRLGSSRGAGLIIVLSLAIQAALVSARVPTAGGAPLWETAGLLASTGALVGALFAFASLHAAAEPARAIGRLYAADLAGGAVGAVAGTLLLIPLAGLVATSAAVALLAIVAVLLVG